MKILQCIIVCMPFMFLVQNSFAMEPLHIFEDGKPARASEVNENFQLLKERIEELNRQIEELRQKISVVPEQTTSSIDTDTMSIVKALTESAADLVKRADKGAGSVGEARGMIAAYNKLLQETKIVFKDNPLVEAMKDLQSPNGTVWDVMFATNEMVGVAAKRLQIFLEGVK